MPRPAVFVWTIAVSVLLGLNHQQPNARAIYLRFMERAEANARLRCRNFLTAVTPLVLNPDSMFAEAHISSQGLLESLAPTA